MTDVELVEQALAGNDAAFGDLVDRHRVSVVRAALAALGSPAEAEDAAQDAFLAAYRKLRSFRGESSFKTWLLAITWRTALDRRRSIVARLRRFVSHDSYEEERWAPPSPVRTQEAALIDAELAGHVHRLARRLPAKLRDALLLSASEDHTYDEIAALLGIPVGTLKWRVAEGRRQLKRRLAALGYADE